VASETYGIGKEVSCLISEIFHYIPVNMQSISCLHLYAYGRKHELACRYNKQFSVHKFIELYPSATKLCCFTEDEFRLLLITRLRIM
jgi:hypothetical protein